MSIVEVAKRAGVSSSTISRVINHQPGVSGETVANVRRIMQEIGYVPAPNRPGRRRAVKETRRTTDVVFLVVSETSVTHLPGFQKLMGGICAEMNEQDIKLSVEVVPSLDEARALNLGRHGVDGVLALLHASASGTALGRPFTHLPTVWLMSNPVRPAWGDQVLPATEDIGHIAAEYLVRAGRKRLAFLMMRPQHWASELRFHAFQYAAHTLGAEAVMAALSPAVSDRCGVDDVQHAQPRLLAEAADHLADDLLRKHPDVDGVFAGTDAYAALLIPALQRRGIDVGPGCGLEMISCDNERPHLLGLHPCPPTIDIHVDEIGRRGVTQLLQRIAEGGSALQTRLTVTPSLVMPDAPVSPSIPSGIGL